MSASDVFGSLQSCVRANYSEVTADDFGVAGAAAGVSFEELLYLEALAELVDCSGSCS